MRRCILIITFIIITIIIILFLLLLIIIIIVITIVFVVVFFFVQSFRDIQCQVKGMGSLAASLDSLFGDAGGAEQIDGVACEQCQARTTHTQSSKLAVVPHILSLQLRRFDMNWQTMQR